MPHIKIIGPTPGTAHSPHAAHGSRVFLDGVEVHELCDFSVHFPVDGVVRLAMDVLATEQVTFEGAADVHITIVAMDGYELMEEMLPGPTPAQYRRRFTSRPV